MFVHNMIEANGKTVRENNLAKTHVIPLGSLVEINLDYNEEHGCRLFVVEHSRDCDGTPLYTLSHNKNAAIELNKFKAEQCDDQFDEFMRQMCMEGLKGSMTNGWSDDCLIVIR